jgi:hypothetical protein
MGGGSGGGLEGFGGGAATGGSGAAGGGSQALGGGSQAVGGGGVTGGGSASGGGEGTGGGEACPLIEIIDGTYGANCGAMTGLNTAHIQATCEGKLTCEYRVDIGLLGDSAPGCMKNYVVNYRCCSDRETRTSVATAEATGKLVFLECVSPPGPGIRVERASYGHNCMAPEGNATWSVGPACNAEAMCSYDVKTSVLGDPWFGCSKDFEVDWDCGASTSTQSLVIPADAAGQTAMLHCP